jgi:hypothetical protein
VPLLAADAGSTALALPLLLAAALTVVSVARHPLARGAGADVRGVRRPGPARGPPPGAPVVHVTVGLVGRDCVLRAARTRGPACGPRLGGLGQRGDRRGGAAAGVGVALVPGVAVAAVRYAPFHLCNGSGWPLPAQLLHEQTTSAQRSATVSAVSLALMLGRLSSPALPRLAEAAGNPAGLLTSPPRPCSPPWSRCDCVPAGRVHRARRG